MDALEYLRQKKRMCEEQLKGSGSCRKCEMGKAEFECSGLEMRDPEKAVQIVSEYAERHPVEGGIRLTAMEQIFVKIYIERGYIWAARDRNGELRLYKRMPKRGDGLFTNTSPAVHSCRTAMSHMLPIVTWENSPVCLPRLLEKSEGEG